MVMDRWKTSSTKGTGETSRQLSCRYPDHYARDMRHLRTAPWRLGTKFFADFNNNYRNASLCWHPKRAIEKLGVITKNLEGHVSPLRIAFEDAIRLAAMSADPPKAVLAAARQFSEKI